MKLRALAASAAVLLLASATARAADFTVSQADYPDPGDATAAVEDRQNPDSIEIALLRDAYEHIKAGHTARLSGREDDARDEDRKAAVILNAFVDKYPSHRNRIVLLRMATERFLGSGEWEKAANTAQRMINDKDAQPVTKAIAARYAAGAWQMVAVTDMKSGKIPPLKLVPSGARQGQPLSPKVPDLPWRMFVEGADTYVKYADADPSTKMSAEERKSRGGADAAQLQTIAAQVEFGYDNMEDAQRRLAAVVTKYPDRADLMESAVPLYLDTFQFTGDRAGQKAAADRLLPVMTAEATRTAQAAVQPGATDAQKKEAEIYRRLLPVLRNAGQGNEFSEAADRVASADALAKEGKAAEASRRYVEAGALYEKFATENKDSSDAPSALFNAGIVYDKAKDGKKAVAVRRRLVTSYPDAKVVAKAMILLGEGQMGEKDFAGAADTFSSYLARWPEGPDHCLALQHAGYVAEEVASSLSPAKKGGKAAPAPSKDAEMRAADMRGLALRSYQSIAKDPACTKGDANLMARALYNVGKMYVIEADKAGADKGARAAKVAEAKKAFQELANLKDVTGVVEKSYQADAKERLKTLK